MITIRSIQPDEWRRYRAIRLRALEDSPDAFGSTLSAEQARPDALWRDRLETASTSGRDCPLFAIDTASGDAVGLLWAKTEPGTPKTVHLYQMWVAPEQRGRGVGGRLLGTAIDWARDIGADIVELGVTCGDTPAVRLYARFGFTTVGSPEPLRPGSPLQIQTMRLNVATAPLP